jgi:hypothetical protein
MRFAIAALVALVAATPLAFGEPTAAPQCQHDRQALLALTPQAFDADLEGGWRPLADREGCLIVAADLIAAYRAAHADLSDQRAERLRWHEAQLRAAAGETDAAIALFATTYRQGDTIYVRANNLYSDATLAFLRRDRAALERARAELAALPKPDGFEEAVENARRQYGEDFARGITWPNNLDVIDGFIACFDKPYREAYRSECRRRSAR